MQTPPSVAIVILNWNGKAFLQQFLPSVLATTYPRHRIIVADNASTDDSVAFLAAHYPQVQCLVLSRNYGFAGGYNEALRQVDADYYMLLNSDVEVTPGWLEPMVALLENDANAAACGPKILAYHNKQLFEYAGGAGGWMDAFGYPFARGRVFDVCETDKGQYNHTAPVFWASGAALLIKSKCFHAMRGFDARFFAHMEEIDLCWRLQQRGYGIYCVPASVVYHVGGGTLPQGNSRKTFLNFRNNLMMLAKNLPVHERWWKLPYRMLLDLVAAIKALLSGDAGYFRAVLKALFAFLRWWIFEHRNQHPAPPKPLQQYKGLYAGHLVVAFFLKKKKTFSSIVKENF